MTIRALAVLCLLSCAAVAQAQRVPGCACGAPAHVPAPFTIRHLDPTFQEAATEAFNAWNRYVDVFNVSVDTSTGASTPNGVNEIYFTDFSDVPGLDPTGLLGLTRFVPDTAFGDFNECPVPSGSACTGSFEETDVLMNGNTSIWSTTRPGIGTDDLYYQATATHELGHTLGFHHNWANFSEMNYLPHFTRHISRTDVLEARQQFPSRVRTVTDLATYPFTYDPAFQIGSGDGADAVTVANVRPSAVAPGGKITINNWTVENLSNGAVSQVRLFFYLTSDRNSIPSNSVRLGQFGWDPLTTWSEDTQGTEFDVPSSTPAGTYYLAAVVGSLSGTTLVTDAISSNNSWILPAPITVTSGIPGTPATCSPSSTNVCLVNNRFEVSLTFNGANMQATPFTGGNTGLFAQTSDPSNIEVLLKMIDACGFNAKFWVYSGGTTDQNVVITVVDTKTGTTKTYTNAKGTKFQTITDSGAFNCP